MDDGADYGRAYFTDANWHLVHRIFAEIDRIESFEELAEILEDPRDLVHITPELRRAASHVRTHMDRLAAFDFLNVTSQNASPAVNQSAIDLCDLFRRPQALFVNLPIGQRYRSRKHLSFRVTVGEGILSARWGGRAAPCFTHLGVVRSGP